MNPDTGHIVRTDDREHMRRLLDEGYVELPDQLSGKAKRALREAESAYVPLNSAFNNEVRKIKAKRINKKNAAKAARKRNRK